MLDFPAGKLGVAFGRGSLAVILRTVTVGLALCCMQRPDRLNLGFLCGIIPPGSPFLKRVKYSPDHSRFIKDIE